MKPFIPHSASRAQASNAPAGTRQGRERKRPASSPTLALAIYLARGLAVMGLVGAVVLGWAVVL